MASDDWRNLVRGKDGKFVERPRSTAKSDRLDRPKKKKSWERLYRESVRTNKSNSIWDHMIWAGKAYREQD